MSSIEVASKYRNSLPETSCKHELFDVTVTVPQAIASTMGRQKPSYREGITQRDALLTRTDRSSSGTAPVKITLPRPFMLDPARTIGSYCHPKMPESTS